MKSTPLVQLTLSNNLSLISPTAKYISKLFFEEHSRMETKVCFAIEAMLEYRMKENINSKDMVLTVFEGTNHFYVQLVDKGLPYNISKMTVQILENGLVDSYGVSQLGNDGQKLSLSFRYSYAHDTQIIPEASEEELLDDEFFCRLLTDSEEDIVEAIKCLYSAYEYDYMLSDLYYHDAFKRKINSGKYVAVICENRHHQFVGYCALNNSDFLPDLPEFCNLVTKPFAQGKGIASRLLDFSEKVAREKHYNGINICSAAFHSFTQKISEKFHYTPCGLNLSVIPAEATGKMCTHTGVRASEAISVKLLNHEKIHRVFVPELYRAFVSDVFNKLGANYEFIGEYAEAVEESLTEYDSITAKAANFTVTYVNRAGSDFEEKIKGIVGEVGHDLFEMAGLYVNAGVPSSVQVFECLKKYGFAFSGFLPGTANGDYLFFQKLKSPYPMEVLVLEDRFKKMSEQILETQKLESR